MARILLAILILTTTTTSHGADRTIVRPSERDSAVVPVNKIDVLVLAALRERGIEPANVCSDSVFLRRAYLDVIGTLPEPEALRKFLRDDRPNKRALLIDTLLERDEFADY